MVIATGPFQAPVIPDVAGRLDPGVIQLHSNDYRNPDALPAGRVLVVGAGNSGCQIAKELVRHPRGRDLAAGEPNPVLPQRPLGRDIWWWASGLRVDRITAGSRLGRRLAGRDPVFGDGPRQLGRRYGVAIRPRVTGATGRTVTFQDGTSTEVDAVVWATGYRTDHSWIDVPDAVGDRRATAAGPRGHPGARPVHTGPALAAHPRLRAARLGRRGRGVHRRPYRGRRNAS